MVKPEVIRKRLDKLDEYLRILSDARKYTLEQFLDDPQRYGSVERFLHLAVETLMDMAHHVVAEEGLGPVNHYRDLPIIFFEQGWIGEDLKEMWVRMIGFRNILVHDYLDVDRGIVFEVLQDGLEDLRQLRAVFARFL